MIEAMIRRDLKKPSGHLRATIECVDPLDDSDKYLLRRFFCRTFVAQDLHGTAINEWTIPAKELFDLTVSRSLPTHDYPREQLAVPYHHRPHLHRTEG